MVRRSLSYRASAPFLVKSVRKFNPKMQAFKRVLDLTLSIRGAEGARLFNYFNDF